MKEYQDLIGRIILAGAMIISAYLISGALVKAGIIIANHIAY